jgi:chaperonin GroEL
MDKNLEKMVVFDKKDLLEGVETLRNAVEKTLGPKGTYVLLQSPLYIGGKKYTKDGVSVAKAVVLENKIQDLGVQTVREAALKTAEEAGDGTSTTIIIASSLIEASEDYIDEDDNKNEVIRDMNLIAKEVEKNLVKKSKICNNLMLRKVAEIAGNGDKETAKMVAELYKNTEQIILDRSKTSSTYSEVLDGLVIDRGFTSQFFINNQKTQECVLEDALILFTDTEIDNAQAIEHLLRYVIENDKPLLIVGTLTLPVLATFNLNVQKGNLRFANIIPPSMGYQQELLMKDLAAMTGGLYYSSVSGDNLRDITVEGLGKASKIVVAKNKTVIVPKEKNTEYLNEVKSSEQTDFLNERISKISGNLSTIYVGAKTESETNELYDRIEDVILSCKSAIEQGVLPGGGVALKDAFLNCHVEASDVAYKIMKDGLLSPIQTLSEYQPINHDANIGYDARTGEECDVRKKGIYDPTKVTISALQNAMSVATTIINTNTIVLQ